MKRSLFYIALAILALLSLGSCDKDKGKTKDPLNSTTWTAYDGDYLMVLKFDLGTLSTFYVGNENLERKGPVSSSAYTLTDDTKITFSNLNGSIDNERFRFKTGTLNGDSMTVNYDRWTSASGIDSEKKHLQAVFKKR
jgi:hypothetical protein